jgi:hypothetical protein
VAQGPRFEGTGQLGGLVDGRHAAQLVVFKPELGGRDQLRVGVGPARRRHVGPSVTRTTNRDPGWWSRKDVAARARRPGCSWSPPCSRLRARPRGHLPLSRRELVIAPVETVRFGPGPQPRCRPQ